MDLTKSQHPNSIVLGSAKLEITKSPVTIDRTKKDWSLQQDLLDLGLARGVKISFESSKLDFKADNGTVPIKGLTDVKAKVEFALLERHLPDIAVAMAGLVNVKKVTEEVTSKTVTLTSANVTEVYGVSVTLVLAEPLKNNEYIVLTKLEAEENGIPNALENPVTFKEGQKEFLMFDINGGGFVDYNDIDIIEDAIKNGKAKATYSIFKVTGYTLTKGSGGVAQSIAMKLTNKRKTDDGRIITRTFELPYGFYTGDDSITLKSKNDTDNIAEIPMSFEFTPHPDMVDDNELSEMSLYREIAEQ